MKNAMILLGCPESPTQTAIAIYATHKLSQMDYDVTVVANPAAMKLIDISDPEKYYVKKRRNIDRCIDTLNPGDYDLLLGIIHKDAAVAYFVTAYHLLQTKSIALVFERNIELVEEFTSQIKESTDAIIKSAKAYHNPNPVKVQLNKALKELEDE